MFMNDERRDLFLPLAHTSIPEAAVQRLEAPGITTLEELRDTWTFGNRQLLTDYLGESPLRFTLNRPAPALTRSAVAAGPGESVNLMAAGPVRPLVKHPRGLALSLAQRKVPASEPEPVPLAGRRTAKTAAGKSVSLIGQFPAVRNQGQRGTCVAFATAAYLEFHLSGVARPGRPVRSEQFL